MAIYSAVPPPPEHTANPTATTTTTSSVQVTNQAIDIDAWTISALQSLSVSPVTRGTGTPLAIQIDEETPRSKKEAEVVARNVAFTEEAQTPPRRPPSRRDSQRKRELILKGKEGSRQRRRWENGKDTYATYTGTSIRR